MAPIGRREFVGAGLGAGLGLASTRPALGQAPTILTPRSVKPVVIASPNGNSYRNGGPVTAIQRAHALITQGSDVLDALIAGVNIVELDPEEESVGYGGVPNADGVVQLDASCMHGPSRRAGAVAALEGVRTPSRVAGEVMRQTDHHLLVGRGAQDFARTLGFTIEEDLNTERSRRIWLEWKRRTDPQHYRSPDGRAETPERVALHMVRDGALASPRIHGTINCDGINAKGEICGVTTTSGLFFKISGRVGDSPILGAGLYVDGEVGAAGSTGRGEANLYGLSSFLIVEGLRRGLHPKDAGMEALRRIRANTIEKRLRKPNGDPNFNVSFYILDAKGRFAGVALYGEAEEERGWAGQTEGRAVRYSVCTENGPRTLACDFLLPGIPEA